MAPKLRSGRRRKPCAAATTTEPKLMEEADRISSLPDSLLCHIMSFLRTRTSVRTMSLVSRRWRDLWKYLQVFDFDFDQFKNFKKYADFVDTVLALRKSRDTRKVSFYWDFYSDDVGFDIDRVEMWIRNVAGPHLQEFALSSTNVYVDLSSLLINCTNLISLRHCYFGEYKPMEVQHSSVQFPSLKKLELDRVIDTMDSVIAFLSNYPKLKSFEVCFDSTHELPVRTSFGLKSLKSTNDNFTWTCFRVYENSIFSKNCITLGIIGNFHSMLEAFLDVFCPSESDYVDPVLKRVPVPGEDKLLQLHHSTSKLPLHTTVLNYPEFRYLEHLKFILPCFNSNILVNVLKKCRMLKVLIIQSNTEEPSPLRTWEPQSTRVPNCLKSHLTYIRIEGYQGFEDELSFAEYILRTGLVLETMLIFADTSMDLMNKYSSVKRLLDIPRASTKCQLKFDPVVSS